jgi:NarL family two-component system response regulator LiaR
MPAPIRVLIVDDHAIVREGLRTLLSEEAEIEVVGEAANGGDAIKLVATRRPDVILMDLVMPQVDGIEAIRRIRQSNNACEIVVLTSFSEDQRVRDAIQAGAIGYLLKDALKTDLLRAIRAAMRGEPTLHLEAQRALIRQTTTPPAPFKELTERELDVLRLIAQGKSNREIANALHLTEGTVKGYVSTILDKLQVDDRTQAALYAIKYRLVVDG